MNLRDVVDEALRENVDSARVDTMDAHGMSDNGKAALASATGALSGANGALAGNIKDTLAEHDRKNHPNGYKGGRCKMREHMAGIASESGLNPRDLGLEDNGGAAQGGISPNLQKMRDAKKTLEMAEKVKDKHPHDYNKAVEDFNAARDAYLKDALGESELGAVEKLCQKSTVDNAKDKIKDFISNIAEKISAATKKGEKNTISPAQATAMEKIAEAAGEPVPEAIKDVAEDDPVPAASEESGGTSPGENVEETPESAPQNESAEQQKNPNDEPPEVQSGEQNGSEGSADPNPTSKELRQTMWDARDRLADLRANGGDEMAIAQAEAELRDATAKYDAKKREENAEASQKKQSDEHARLHDEVLKRRQALVDLEERRDGGDSSVTDDDISRAEEDLAKAEKAYDDFTANSLPRGAAPSNNDGGNTKPVAREYEVDGKKYVDVSELGFFDGMRESFLAGFRGNEIITSFDKTTGRFNEIVAKDKKHQQSLDDLKGAMDAMRIAGLFDKFIDATDDDYLKSRIGLFKEDYANAQSTAERNKVLDRYDRFLKSNGLQETPKQKAAREERERAEAEAKKNAPVPTEMRQNSYTGPKASESLLGEPENKMGNHGRAMDSASEIQNRMKAKFGVNAGIENVEAGPASTSIQFSVPDNFNYSLMNNKAFKESLASACGALNVDISRVPGEKNRISVTMKNPKRELVTVADLVNSQEWKNTCQKAALPMAIGKSHDGGYLCSDLTKMRHLQITGETGSGKSVALNTIINSLQTALGPDKVRFGMVDLKGLEFGDYTGSPYLGWGIAKDPQKAASVIASIREEMDNRLKEMGAGDVEFDPNWSDERKQQFENELAAGGRTLESWNAKNPGKEKPHVVLFIDEMAQLSQDKQYGPQAKADLSRILALSRAAGIHCIVSTQVATVDSIPTECKRNIPAKIAFKAKSSTDSVAALNHGGAEQLTGNGDGIFMSNDGRESKFQGAFIGDSKIRAVQSFYRKNWRTNAGDAGQGEPAQPSESVGTQGNPQMRKPSKDELR